MLGNAGAWNQFTGDSWFKGSWFEVPPQVLLRMPGATGPDADFYHTLTLAEYGNAEQKKAARNAAKAKVPTPAPKEKPKPEEKSKGKPADAQESDYFYKLQLRQTGPVPIGDVSVPPVGKLSGTAMVANDAGWNAAKPAADLSKGGILDKIDSARKGVTDTLVEFGKGLAVDKIVDQIPGASSIKSAIDDVNLFREGFEGFTKNLTEGGLGSASEVARVSGKADNSGFSRAEENNQAVLDRTNREAIELRNNQFKEKAKGWVTGKIVEGAGAHFEAPEKAGPMQSIMKLSEHPDAPRWFSR